MGTGCSTNTPVASPTGEMDRRAPLTRTELDEVRTLWDHVKRKFEDTSRECMIRFFRLHPYFLCMFPNLQNMDEDTMRQSHEFEAQAMITLAVFDDIIENMDSDLDGVLMKLEDLAHLHARIENFSSEFFQYLEEPFIEALREKVWEKFGSREEELFRKLFKWVSENMSLEVEAIEYRLIPGD